MTVYKDAINTAWRLLAAKGQRLTISQLVPGTFDPVTQAETGASASTAETVGVILPKGTTRAFRDLTEHFTAEALVACRGVTVRPAPGGTITDAAGKAYSVVNVKDLAPDGADIVWTVALEA